MFEAARLERECDAFCRYLCGAEADAYVRSTYVRAHELARVDPPGGVTSFDRALVALARSGSFMTRASDAYARVFAKSGLLRRKLVVLLAILECSASTHAAVDSATRGTKAGFLARAVVLFAASMAMAIVLGVVLLPVRLWCARERSSAHATRGGG